jgi:LmbE family N-acetylglucosaminyl deacetylase
VTTAGEIYATFDALPEADVTTVLYGGTVLILAPHPDDEVLGCGGLIAQAVQQTLPPLICFVTDGTGSHPNSRSFPADRLRRLRERESREAAVILGLPSDRLTFLRLRDTVAPHEGPLFQGAVGILVEFLLAFRCTGIFAPWQLDPHCDHVAAHLMAAAAAARTGIRHISYPVWGLTLPTDADIGDVRVSGWRLPIGRQLDLKRRALIAHASQLGGVIFDDPSGFELNGSAQHRMLRPYEIFLRN